MATIVRADVVGSLMTPPELAEARARNADEELDAHALKQVEDAAVDAAIALQERVGMDVVTDGELRRRLFMGPLEEGISGVSVVDGGPSFEWHREDDGALVTETVPVAVTERIRATRSVVTEEFTYARARASAPVKVTVPSPGLILHLWSNEHSRPAYDNPFELIADAAEVVRAEVRELVRLGCQHIQIDAPELTHYVDPAMQAFHESLGVPVERLLGEGLELIDGILQDVPSSVRRSIHLCRGNNTGMWLAQGGYDDIAIQLFRGLSRIDAFLLEYDDHRSGSFEPLTHVPDDKMVVLGLVTTKAPGLESADELEARVHEAARHISLDQLAISTQCGFAPGDDNPPLTEADQEAKLELVAGVARSIWG
jgi:5-methyltetrahydropteroyltriglutamate--homocysteine methyltransferase